MNELIVGGDPQELHQGHLALMEQIDHKIIVAKADAKSAAEMKDQMLAAKMDVAAANKLHKRATERVGYLIRVKSALAEGYFMLPDMPGEIIAVRTDETKSNRNRQFRETWNIAAVKAKHSLAMGEGEYVSENPAVETQRVEVEKTKYNGEKYLETVTERRAASLRSMDSLDARFMKPQIVSRLSKALALKLFDEIVCVGGSSATAVKGRKDRDPIVLGRIITDTTVTAFLIAWFVDSAEL